jgi:hypothetical protein
MILAKPGKILLVLPFANSLPGSVIKKLPASFIDTFNEANK